MDVVVEWWCGLDVHKRTVVACLLRPGADRHLVKEVRTDGTGTDQVQALAAWVPEAGCTQGAMESTGLSWNPGWTLWAGQFALLLVTARRVTAVPRRKTDGKDCEGRADLLRHGVLHPSGVADRSRRERQAVTRDRPSLVQERSA